MIIFWLSISDVTAVSAGGNEFDPLREWGEPQQLPLPPSPTPGDNANQASGDQKPAAASSKPAAEKKKTIAKVAYHYFIFDAYVSASCFCDLFALETYDTQRRKF